MEDDAGRRMRQVRASVDTRNRQPYKLPVEGVPFDAVEQGGRRRQDARSANQDGAQPEDEGNMRTLPKHLSQMDSSRNLRSDRSRAALMRRLQQLRRQRAAHFDTRKTVSPVRTRFQFAFR